MGGRGGGVGEEIARVEQRPHGRDLRQGWSIGGAVGESFFARGVSLPCATDLTDADQDRVIAAVRSFYED